MIRNLKNRSNQPNGPLASVAWKFSERILAQGVSLIVSIVLARLLMPDEYGLIALVLVFINIVNVLVTNGLGLSLIQKKNSDDIDFSTVFYLSLFIGIVLFFLVFAAAPYLAKFYENDLLCPIVRVLGIKIILASVNSIQQAYISKYFLFQKFFFATLFGTLVSGIVGISMAYSGFGVWSLVAQYLVNSLIGTIVLFITLPWRPKLAFSMNKGKVLFSYAWKLMISGFINTTFGQLKNLIIGKIYSKADLAFYEKGNYFPQIIISNLNSAVSDVVFPFMAKKGDKAYEIKCFAKKSLRNISYIVTPCMIGLILIAKNLITVLLTNKWINSVPYLQIMCIYWLMQPMQTINWQILKAIGRSDLCLKLEIIKKGISLVILFMVMNISINAIIITSVALAVVSSIINAIPVKKLISYSIKEQIIDIMPSFYLSLGMAVVVYSVTFLNLSAFISLIIQCIVGVVVYLLLSALTQNQEYLFLKVKIRLILTVFKSFRV